MKYGLAFVALCLVLVVSAVLWPSRDPEADWRHYRITTDLETEGQPFQLDVVVQCRGLEVLRSGGGGLLSYTQLPYLYGRPTAAGHAVLMRLPDFCGLLSSGHPKDKERVAQLKERMSLPLILWMPDKADIDRMTAYTSLKGYESPGSTLKYVGTRFSEATREEWRAWMASAGEPFIRRRNDPFWYWDDKGLRSGQAPNRLPLECNGLLLLPIPSSLQDDVRKAWPEGKPLIWDNMPLWLRLRDPTILALGPQGRFFPSLMYSTGIDVIPYEGRSVRAQTDPLGSAYPAGTYVTIKRIDLDTPVRGRAECLRGSSSYPNIWIFKSGGETARYDRKSLLFVRDQWLFSESTSRVHLIEGSHEGMYP